MSWIKDLFGVQKPIIAMCHLEALPGDPAYDPKKGMQWVVERARNDMLALQDGCEGLQGRVPVRFGVLLAGLRQDCLVP